MKSQFITGNPPTELLNIDITDNGHLTQRRGWRSFWGMVWELYQINKRYQKFNMTGEFIIKLPLQVCRKPKGLIDLSRKRTK